MKFLILAIAVVFGSAASSYAGEEPVPIKNAPGRDIVENNCASCHSLDYPRTNSVFMDRKTWQAEVDKMINAYGAPIEPKDAAVIVDYLVKNYGTGS